MRMGRPQQSISYDTLPTNSPSRAPRDVSPVPDPRRTSPARYEPRHTAPSNEHSAVTPRWRWLL